MVPRLTLGLALLPTLAFASPPPCGQLSVRHAAQCQNGVRSGSRIWTDRTYSWINAPNQLLGGSWTYIRPPLSTGTLPCTREGGFNGRASLPAGGEIAICCSNHQEPNSAPTSNVSITWTELSGSYRITDHDVQPCTFFKADITRLQASTMQVCCSGGWASGIFLSQHSAAPTSAPTQSTTTTTTTVTTETFTTHTAFEDVHRQLNSIISMMDAQSRAVDSSFSALNNTVTALLSNMDDRISSVEGETSSIRAGILSALQQLPVVAETVGPGQCTGGISCEPVIEAIGTPDDGQVKNLVMRAPGGSVFFDTVECGGFDACELRETLRQVTQAMQSLTSP